jgi:hypothetical protein
MQSLLLWIAVLSTFAVAKDKGSFTQKVDHFDPFNQNTWQQEYILYRPLPTNSSPVFLFLGGEAPVEFFEFQEVAAFHWAQDVGAGYIALEHRYYHHFLAL